MKAAEYRGMSDDQLRLSLKELTKNLFHLRFQSATERLETPSEIKKTKREIAMVQTIMRQRELEEMTKLDDAALASRIAEMKGKAYGSTRIYQNAKRDIIRLENVQKVRSKQAASTGAEKKG